MEKKNVRIEKDFLGEKEVEKEAYYGIQTLRAVENFPITGYRIDPESIKAMTIVKKAAAIANFETGRFPAHLQEAMVRAANEIIEGEWHAVIIVDTIQSGAGTSVNMNANEVIGNRALEILGKANGDYAYLSPNSHVNMAQSSNDSFPTAYHIAIVALSEKLLA